jgi:hypothetical protein
VNLAELEGRLSAAAGRLAPNLSVYEALLRGLPVARARLDSAVLTAIGEPLEGEPLELDEELALRVEVARFPLGIPSGTRTDRCSSTCASARCATLSGTIGRSCPPASW